MQLSIVTTLYQSASHVQEFYNRLTGIADELTRDYEIIFVVDGSPDDSLGQAVPIFEKDQRVKIIDLSRNFGHHKAIMTGLSHSRGDVVFLIDSDLEEDPELLRTFWESLNNNPETDVIVGVQRETRKLPFLTDMPRTVFYKTIDYLSNEKIDPNEMVVRLMRRCYVDALVRHTETNIFLPGIWSNLGFKKKSVEAEKKVNSQSSYTLSKKASLAIDAITSFSAKPLYLMFVFGSIISLIAIFILLFVIYQKLVMDMAVGWASLIVSIWTGIGLIMMSLGVIGIYLSKIFSEVKNRPYSIVRRLYSHDGDG
jgi:putative glycosyltransferase